jgi:hypothetical protein
MVDRLQSAIDRAAVELDRSGLQDAMTRESPLLPHGALIRQTPEESIKLRTELLRKTTGFCRHATSALPRLQCFEAVEKTSD